MAFGILNMESTRWSAECGMDSAGDCCSKLADESSMRKVLVISGMRTESKAGL